MNYISMKKFKTILFVVITTLTITVATSCADNKTINGVTYRPYGLLNESTCKNDSVEYQISGEAFVVGIIFVELIVPPIYIFGYNFYEPVGLKKDFEKGTTKGVVN